MLFNSLDFFIFFPTVCIIYFLIPWLKIRNAFLLIASYYFYMNWEPVYALLLLSGTVITFFAALGIERFENRKKLFLTVSIVLNLSILFFFKYYEFAADSLTYLLQLLKIDIPMPHFTFLLPAGISFYTFQALGYSIDVYRGATPVVRDFFRYALFVSFFPQLVAGPIERSTNLLPQFNRKHTFDYERVMHGIYLMAWGYFLKLVLADRCAVYVDAVLDNLYHHNGGSYLLATLLFPFQIYGDFAGYSLIAIGAAKVMGFSLMDNFRRPYLATSVTDFWHRWHISLSSWFKDYLYIPLGGSRKGDGKTYRNLLLTFGVSGLWHGANWTFLIWGLIHGIILSVERYLGLAKQESSGFAKFIKWLVTFMVVCLAWIFFRANSVNDAFHVFKGVFTDPGIPFLRLADLGAITMALAVVFIKEIIDEKKLNVHLLSSPYWIIRNVCLAGLICFTILFGVLNGDQFIYFQF